MLCLFLILIFIGIHRPPVYSSVQNPVTWTWSTLKVVSDQSNMTSMDPNIVVDDDFNIHVIWGEQAPYTSAGDDDVYQDVIYQRWNLFSEEYYAPVLVSNTSTGAASNPHCTMDSSGNLHVVWEDSTVFFKDTNDKDIVYRMWNASTEEWTQPMPISIGSNNSFDPVIAVTDSGERHVFWTEQNAPQEIYHRAYINDQWQTIEEISVEDEDYDSIWPDVAIDDSNNIHLTWTDFSGYNGAEAGTGSIFYKKYDETLNSWLATVYISTESTEEAYRSRISLDSGGNPHIVWIDRTELPYAEEEILNQFDVFYKTLNPHTSTWTPTEVISVNSTEDCGFPCLVIDPSDNFHIVWRDQTNYGSSGSDSDIYYKYKNSTSGTWDSMTLLTAESSENSDDPEIFCDKLGFLHLIWLDFMDIVGAGEDPDIFYKFLSGEPTTPSLSPIIQNNNNPKELELQWTASNAATSYKIYRESSSFSSTSGLSSIEAVVANEYTDTVNTSGTYYYAITAENSFGSSRLSNVVSITVDLSTTSSTTTSSFPSPGFSFFVLFVGVVMLSRRK